MKNLFNPTKQDVTVWYGHTPYFVPAGDYCEVEDDIADIVVGHNDYKDLQVVPAGERYEGNPETEGSPGKQAGEGQDGDGKDGEEVLTSPWDSAEWNPIEAPLEQVLAYADKHDIKLGDNEAVNRQIVDEHFLASME